MSSLPFSQALLLICVDIDEYDVLVISKWPPSLNLSRIYLALAGQEGDNLDDLPLQPWESVPFQVQDLVKWAYLDRDDRVDDRTRRMVYLYSLPREISASTGSLIGVTLRMQGFLVAHKIKPLGNYEGCVYPILLYRFLIYSLVTLEKRQGRPNGLR